MTEYVEDPADKMRAMVVGDWATEKRVLVEQYIDSSRAARRQYVHRAYVDLFCGPGRVWMRDAQRFEDGCALGAWKKSQEKGVPFSQVYIADIDQHNVECCAKRLEALGAPVVPLVGDAKKTVVDVMSGINHFGLHLAVLDPFGLSTMPITIIAELARAKRMDLLVHFSQNDLQRNLPTARNTEDSEIFEAFAPGWRESVASAHQTTARSQYFQHWINLVEAHDGYKLSRRVPLITNSRNAPLYKLVLFSRHPLAEKLWNDVAKGPQQDLF